MYPVYNYSEKYFQHAGNISDFIDLAFDREHAMELVGKDVELFEVFLCQSNKYNILRQFAESIDVSSTSILIRDDKLYLLAYFRRDESLPVFDKPVQSITFSHKPIGEASNREEALRMLNSQGKTYMGNGVVRSDNGLGYFPAEDKWF
jgi:hypothetical protein